MTTELTDVNESPRRSFAELFALVRECHLDHSWYVPRRSVDSYSVRSDQLAPDEHCAEDHLQALITFKWEFVGRKWVKTYVEEVVADDDNGVAALRPPFARRDRFDARSRHRQRRINACWCGHKFKLAWIESDRADRRSKRKLHTR